MIVNPLISREKITLSFPVGGKYILLAYEMLFYLNIFNLKALMNVFLKRCCLENIH